MYNQKMPVEAMYQQRLQARSGKSIVAKVAAVTGILGLVATAGIAISSCGTLVAAHEPVNARQQFPAILRRDPDESVPDLQSYDYSAPIDAEISRSLASGAAAARATGEDAPEETDIPVGVSVPIFTQTSLHTIYTIRTPDANTTRTSTTTMTTTIVIVPSETTSCASHPEEETEVVTVTVTVVPEVSGPPAYGPIPSDVTVTGDPATVTDVQTDVSYTSGAPDATVSGTPATVTDVQTDTSYTSGAPDATVSGEPATVTSVITNSVGEPMTTLTFTSFSTVRVTVTTVTRHSSSSVEFDSSVLGLPHTVSTSSAPLITYTETVTVTGGEPATSTTTVELLEAYTDSYQTPYGTGVQVNATAKPTYTPPVVSAGVEVCHLQVAYLIFAAMTTLCLF